MHRAPAALHCTYIGPIIFWTHNKVRKIILDLPKIKFSVKKTKSSATNALAALYLAVTVLIKCMMIAVAVLDSKNIPQYTMRIFVPNIM
jgi:hypothetical protein